MSTPTQVFEDMNGRLNPEKAKKINSTYPVSYTHLDVYKRQGMRSDRQSMRPRTATNPVARVDAATQHGKYANGIMRHVVGASQGIAQHIV